MAGEPVRKCDTHSDALVARAKTAMAMGFTVKAVAHHLGLPYTLVRDWKCGKRRSDIQLSAATKDVILRALKGNPSCGRLAAVAAPPIPRVTNASSRRISPEFSPEKRRFDSDACVESVSS